MAPSSVRLESTFCRNFTCCGRELDDLHDLLQHYEECHVRFEDDISLADEDSSSLASSRATSPDVDKMSASEIKRMRHSSAPGANALVTPSAEDLDSPSAFDTAVMSSPSVSGKKRSFVQVGSFGTTASQSLHRSLVEGGMGRRQLGSIYSAGSPFSTPGTSRAGTPTLDGDNDVFFGPTSQSSLFSNISLRTPAEEQQLPSCAPPNLFFPTSNAAQARTIKRERLNTGPSATPQPQANSGPASPAVSVESQHSEHRPYKCPAPGCDKAYKQMNGLKYHRLHGHCNQNLRNSNSDLVSGKAPEQSVDVRDSDSGPMQPDLRVFGINPGPGEEKSGIQSPSGKSAIASQPEKAYVCQVGNCDKRYKNLNGLRYHYLHSGSHGLLGLQLLHANGGGASAKADGTGRPPVSTDTLSREQIVQAAAAAQALLNQQMQAQTAKTSSAINPLQQMSSTSFHTAAACNGSLLANAGQVVNE